MGVKVKDPTVRAWGLFISLLAVIFGLSHLGVLPFDLTMGTVNGLLLLLLSTTIITETIYGKRMKINTPEEAISVVIAAAGILLAVVSFGFASIPSTLQGAMGIIYFILSVMVVYVIFT